MKFLLQVSTNFRSGGSCIFLAWWWCGRTLNSRYHYYFVGRCRLFYFRLLR